MKTLSSILEKPEMITRTDEPVYFEFQNPYLFASLLQGLRETVNPGVRGSVDLYPGDWYEERDCRLFAAVRYSGALALTPLCIAAVTEDGELVSLCASPGNHAVVKDFLKEILFTSAFRYLQCLETNKLRALYSELGLRRVAGMPWDSDLKPEGWNSSRFGRPSFMVYASRYLPRFLELDDTKQMFTSSDAFNRHLQNFDIVL